MLLVLLLVVVLLFLSLLSFWKVSNYVRTIGTRYFVVDVSFDVADVVAADSSNLLLMLVLLMFLSLLSFWKVSNFSRTIGIR